MPSLTCPRCHRQISAKTGQTVCPLCGVALLAGPDGAVSGAEEEVDHRGVILPKRHLAGGIITPQ